MIAGLEVYWTVTSKKLNVMYSSLYYTDMLFPFHHDPNPELNRQFGGFDFLPALWLMDVGRCGFPLLGDSERWYLSMFREG